jgi:beta-galactosidase GanA
MPTSRRTFLKGTGAGLGAAWGGVRILAEPGGSSGARGAAPPAGPFLYGTHFYRPPNPPRGERREMLRAIAQHYHFNIIRIYPTWDYYHRAPEAFVFDEIEEVMRYCDEFGLKVLMGIVMETAPYWLEQAHPETRFVDAKGQPLRLAGSSAQITGGWPGLCLDWEPVRQAASRFIQELAKVVAPHPSMYAYDVWNEPHIEPSWPRNIWAVPQERLFCYCPRTIAEFQQWLERRYQTIERLNEAWTRQFPNFEAIDPPRALGTYADWVDWRRYILERSTRYMHFRADTVRAADARHVIESHGAHHPPIDSAVESGTNAWRLAEVVDVWGLSNFPRWAGSPLYLGAAKLDLTRSNAAGKDFWMTELQGGHANTGLSRSPEMRPRDIRTWNWIAVAGGAKGIVYWAYLAEATGREATGFGLVNRDGSTTERAEEAARNQGLIQEHWELIRGFQHKPRIAILFDYDNALLAYAMSGEEEVSTSSFRGYYQALWQMDLRTDFIEPAGLEKGDYQVVIVPWHPMGKKQTCESLRRFAASGGTVILETAFGLFDENCYYNPVVPPHGLEQAFGYREEQSLAVFPKPAPENAAPSDRVYYQPEIRFTAPAGVRLKGHTFLTPLRIISAQPIATSFEHTVAARKQVEKGEVYYIGTNLGASIAAGEKAGIELLRAIVGNKVRPDVTAEKLRPRLIEGSSRSLLAVFNDTPQDQTSEIRLPARYRKATDLHRHADVPLTAGSLTLTVPFEDVVVLLLE